MSVDLNALTCGRNLAPGNTASIAARLRSNVGTSTSNAGVVSSDVVEGSARIAPIMHLRAGGWRMESLAVTVSDVQLDLDFVRSNFPAFSRPINDGPVVLRERRRVVRVPADDRRAHRVLHRLQGAALQRVRPSRRAGELMDRSRERWAEALGVEAREVVFGPSTSANTYVLAHAFADVLEAGNEVIVTNQDHEANTGAIRRAAERVGCTVKEWTDRSRRPACSTSPSSRRC
jgi:hypothetical protein